MYRQKAVSRIYIIAIVFLCTLCVLTSLLTYWKTNARAIHTSQLTLPLESDVAICLARFSDNPDSVETDEDDWQENSDDQKDRLASIISRRISCQRSADLFQELGSSDIEHYKARLLVDRARANTGCHGKHPLDYCGSNRPKPVVLSRRAVNGVREVIGQRSLVVPNVVHFIRFGNMSFDFQQYVTFLSVQKFQKPDAIFIHGDYLPDASNYWWNKTITDIDNLYHIFRRKPVSIFGRTISFIEHAADFARLQILIEYGGIYLDHDVILIKSMDELRSNSMTLGREMPSLLANGIILAERRAQFLRIWIQAYKTYDARSWSAHSTHIPHSLAILFPHLIHVEDRSLVRPNWSELHLLYFSVYSHWRTRNFCIHLYLPERYPAQIPVHPAQLDNRVLRNTVTEVMRHVINA